MADWAGLDATTNHVHAGIALAGRGWAPCGTGDWATVLASPDRTLAARISPFDPTGPLTAQLYREAAATGRVPRLLHHARLEGGGDLLVMEYLLPVARDAAAAFLDDVAAGAGGLGALAAVLHRIHTEGAAVLPWCGPLDTNPANVMRRADGTLVLTDPFYADGPRLYAAASADPARVVRLIPPHERRYLTEIPLAGSGPWADGEQDRIRAGLAAADAAIAGR